MRANGFFRLEKTINRCALGVRMTYPSIKRMSDVEYHSRHEISKSGLDRIHKSPAHFQAWLKNPPEQTPAMAFGSAAHQAILEPAFFKENYVVQPQIDRRTKAGKEEFEAFLINNHGKRIVCKDDYETIAAMIDSVYSHKSASKLLTHGTAELSFFWQDQTSGVQCRCRPDFLKADGVIVDVKTTDDASPKGFARSIAKFRYHVQAAFYLDGISASKTQKADTFVLIAIEKTYPFAVATYQITDFDMALGRDSYRKNLHTFAECLKTNTWPAYSSEIEPIALPAWAQYEE
jgi:hypothetical protein